MNTQTKASGDVSVNRAELRAVTHATIIAANFDQCNIYTDSQYAVWNILQEAIRQHKVRGTALTINKVYAQ